MIDLLVVKVFKRILILSTGLLVLLVVSLFGLAYVFEDEIIAKTKTLINQSVDTQIDVAELEFSLLHNFPNASLLFSEVTIADKLDSTKTLLFVDLLSLQFDILDLVNENYSIDKIHIQGGTLSMRTRADGEVNFIFWKENEDDTEMSFDVQSLTLENIAYSYQDEPAELSLKSTIEKAELKGGLSDSWIDLTADLSGVDTDLSVSGVDYLLGNQISFDGDIRLDQEGTDINFTDSRIDVGPMKIPVKGRVHKEQDWMVDLTIEGEAELDEFLAQLPPDQKGELDSYGIHGEVSYLMHIQGASTGSRHPALDMDFTLKQGSMKFSDEGTVLKGINAQGRYQRSIKGVDKVDFDAFIGSLPQGDIAFTGSIEDFDQISVNGKLTCESNFGDIIGLADQQMISSPRGHVKVEIDLDGRLPDKEELSLNAVKGMNMFGQAQFTDVGFDLVGNGYKCEGLNSVLVLKGDAIILDDVLLQVNNDPIAVNGSVNGIWEYLLTDNGLLDIKADVSCAAISWDNWAAAANPTSGGVTRLPEDIKMRISFDVGQFTYQSFDARNLSGMLAYAQNKLKVEPISFETCQGKVNSELQLHQKKDLSWKVSAMGSISNVDVPELFRQFDGFGQNFLTSEHLRGKGDALINFSSDMDSLMNIDKRSIFCTAELNIEDGELIEHPSMIGIVEELRERHLLKPFVRADELEREMHHLSFQRLSNTIRIEDEVIYIPKMDIANNAMDIGISGQHGFDQSIDYTLDFTLRDILVNKRNPEFLIQDDGLGHRIHLSMSGTVDDPVIELDKEVAKENRKEAIAEAKEDIKEFFSNPFKKKEKEADDRAAVVVEIEGADKKEEEVKPKKEKKQWWKVDSKDDEEEVPVPEDEDDF